MRSSRRITFTLATDIDCIVLAEFGLSNKAIANSTGYSDSQIAYRLHKAKVADGKPKGRGYRTDYRDGYSTAASEVLEHFGPKHRKWAATRLPPHFAVDNSPAAK